MDIDICFANKFVKSTTFIIFGDKDEMGSINDAIQYHVVLFVQPMGMQKQLHLSDGADFKN